MSTFRPSGKFFLFLFITLVIAALAGSSYYFFSQYQEIKRLVVNPTEASRLEVKEVTTKLKKLINLPAKEDPIIATIIDASKLKSEPFLAQAKNGDKILYYTNARKAILYRPSENIIIDVAPLILDSRNSTPSGQQKPATSSSTIETNRLTPTIRP